MPEINQIDPNLESKGLYKQASKAIDNWLYLHKGETFDLDLICRQLNITDAEKRNLITIKLAYEVKHGNLEKSNRLYRYINKDINNIPWYESGEDAEYVDIIFPSNHQPNDMSYFSFQDSIRISPGAVMVFAGKTNAGKSLFARNLVWDNMNTHYVRYLVSQTSGAAFARYANNMTWEDPMRAPKTPKFDLIERYEDFQDVIEKDAFNIVDWLDADKVEYYKIGMLIKQMQIKVGRGVLAVMIQKNGNAEFGDGGIKSAKWADLYCSIDNNRDKNFTYLTIVKAKEWVGNIDPNGKMFGFEIINYGSQLADIREVKKCNRCWGLGKTKQGEECGNCGGIGYVDAFQVTHKAVQNQLSV